MTSELLIVGAGPAGVSAALWARSLGLTALVLEGGAEAGGQLHHVHFHPEELLLSDERAAGPELAATLTRQLASAGVEVRFDTVAVALEPGGPDALPAVRDGAQARYEAEAVLIASGVRRRRLDVPGESELEGRGVSYSATRDRARFAGKPVVVVGGGDAAFENALLLSDVGCAVTLALRAAPRARLEFRERVKADPRITLLAGTRVTAILGRDQVHAVRLASVRGVEDVPAAGVVIKAGVIPNTEWCRAVLEHDTDGFLTVDEHGLTSDARVWAAGDVTRPALPSVPVAAGQAALVTAHIRRELRARFG